MVNTTASRLGQVNSLGADDALFLKVFSGEVLAAFDEVNVMAPLVRTRTITSGKSAQFPALGRTATAYHAAGENILDPANLQIQTVNAAERVVTIDDLLTSPVFVDALDEAKNHYDVRSEYTKQMGRALAKAWDERLLRVGLIGARNSTAVVTGLPTGTTAVEANFNTAGADAQSRIFTIAQTFDEKDVPEMDRNIAISPACYYNLIQNQELLNRDFGGQNGIFSDGTVFKCAGITLRKTNHIPDTNFTADGGEGDSTTEDFQLTLALAWQKEGIGVVKLRDLAMEMEYLIEYQGHLMVGKFAFGANWLRDYCLYEVTSA